MYTALILTIINFYFAKSKIEIFISLVSTFLFIKYASVNIFEYLELGDIRNVTINLFGFWLNILVWLTALYLLLFNQNDYKYRLPFYAIITSILIFNPFGYFGNVNLDNAIINFSTENIISGIVLAAPLIYIITKLFKEYGLKYKWQFIACVVAIIAGMLLPISNLYIAIFCLLHGHFYRDVYSKLASYILFPFIIFNLYHSMKLTLSSASLVSLIVGIILSIIFVIIKYTKFEMDEAS